MFHHRARRNLQDTLSQRCFITEQEETCKTPLVKDVSSQSKKKLARLTKDISTQSKQGRQRSWWRMQIETSPGSKNIYKILTALQESMDRARVLIHCGKSEFSSETWGFYIRGLPQKTFLKLLSDQFSVFDETRGLKTY